ncbi:MAG: histidinol-phosphate transaminase [Steroidobacteraceae bacterium]
MRRAVRGLPSYSPGRDADTIRRETGFAGGLTKLASNEGPEGPFPAAITAMRECLSDAGRYPEAGGRMLKHALALYHGVTPEEVLVAAGGCGALQHLASALLEEHDEVAYCAPTFHQYRLDAIRAGARPIVAGLDPSGSYDLRALESAISPRTKLVYVCTPNNPTGGLLDRDALGQFLLRLPAHVLPVIDEAYFEFIESPQYPEPWRVQRLTQRDTVVIRSFSKIYGLAGLRVGYAIAPAKIVEVCQRVQNPYEVNRVAQSAALASLDSPEELHRRTRDNRRRRAYLTEGLRALGVAPLPSQTNFVCIKVRSGLQVARALEAQGIIVRPLDAMGDAVGIRVTVGTDSEVELFLAAFRSIRDANHGMIL